VRNFGGSECISAFALPILLAAGVTFAWEVMKFGIDTLGVQEAKKSHEIIIFIR
jgi:hypothetical protein